MESYECKCVGCNKKPDQIDEYIEGASDQGITPEQYVEDEEGTHNSINGHFLCTDCYIKAGMPAVPHPGKWVAP